ncbi:DnaJ family domain-containing protein [Streptosporangium sp. NPDC023825]|uniref:DnaJ family domain-containing protein n=1 Tax=Streptosporangium sp. NPDC023825 TaxID=3154909 RepID=UPI003438A550
MTERKPPGVSFETWIDRQIREATERGEFDNLPGAGKPLPGEGKPQDEMWWIKQKMLEENLTFPLPGTLALRKEAEESLAAAVGARTEAEARKIVGDMNDRIRESYGKPLSGPPLLQPLIDVEEVVADWRARHPVEEKPAPAPGPPRERRSFLRFLRLRFLRRKGHG